MIDIRLPLPVSSNAVWVRTKRGIRKSDKYDAWLREAGYQLNRQKPPKVEGKYKLFIMATRPDKRRRDLDNQIGSVSDLLQAHGLVTDDSLCEFVSAQWVLSGEGVRVVVVPAKYPDATMTAQSVAQPTEVA